MSEPLMEGHHSREDQLFNENVILESKKEFYESKYKTLRGVFNIYAMKIRRLEKDLHKEKQRVLNFRQRNEFMLDIIKKMKVKEDEA